MLNTLKKILFHIVLFLALLKYSQSYIPTFIDDAFLQFQYAKVLSTTGGWGFFPGITINTATSPLNIIILSILSFFTRNALNAGVLLCALEFYFLFVFLNHLSQHLFGKKYFAIFAFIALLTNPLLVSTLGMESWLFLSLFVIALYLYLKERWSLLAVVLGLLTLARPDGVLLFALIFVIAPSRTRMRMVIGYILTVTPWYLISWICLGSFLPDTLIVKMGQGSWEGASFGSGLVHFYLARYPLATCCSFLLLPLVLFMFASENRDVRRLVAIIAIFVSLHFAGYSLLKVPPYHWYYIALASGSVLLGSLGVASLAQRLSKQCRPGLTIAFILLLPVLAFLAVANQDGYPFTEAPIHTNWATKRQYEDIGLWLRNNVDPSTTCTLGAELGTLAYYSDRRLINNMSSPSEFLRHSMQRFRRTHSPLANTLLDWNFYWRRKPPREAPAALNLIHLFDQQDWKHTPNLLMKWETSSSWAPHGTLLLIKNKSRSDH